MRIPIHGVKTAFVTGVTGQDGSYLCELLLDKGYEVHGLVRRSSTFNTTRIEHIRNKLTLHYGDLTDGGNITNLIHEIKPDEIYNLGAQSHVRVSFELPEFTGNTDGLGSLRLLDAIRGAGLEKTCRYYQASSSEMFGKVQAIPQVETTPFYPRSPYGCAKVYAYWLAVNYRESYGLHASNGILFNHESPRRGEAFVTRKITRAATRIKLGLQDSLTLGNLDAKRDWGYAKDYVEMMWRMLQQEVPGDYIAATGETHSVREFCERAFELVGLDWEKYVKHDQKYERPSEVDLLLGNPAKAKKVLGWQPTVKFKDLVSIMVNADMELAKEELHMAQMGSLSTDCVDKGQPLVQRPANN